MVSFQILYAIQFIASVLLSHQFENTYLSFLLLSENLINIHKCEQQWRDVLVWNTS